MTNLKFFILLKTLKPEEVVAFHKYIKQLHEADSAAMKVFRYAQKMYPDFQHGKHLDMAYAYRKIFRGEHSEQNDGQTKMLNTLYDLHLDLKHFLLVEKIRSDKIEQQALWLDILQERGINDEFSKKAIDFYEAVNGTPLCSVKSNLRAVLADHYYHQHLALTDAPKSDIAPQGYLDTLAVCEATIRLKIACGMLSWNSSVRNSDIYQLPEALLTSQAAQKAPLLLWYWEVYQLLKTNQEVHFDRIANILTNGDVQYFDSAEVQGILKCIYNYGAQLIRKGDEIATAEKLHRLNQFAEQHHFFNLKGVMTPAGLNNIVNVACAVKDFDWLNTFVEKQRHLMPPTAITLAEATIFFEQQKFGEVLDLLNKISFRDTHDAMRSKLLILRSYYSLGEKQEFILSQCRNFESWLRRHHQTKPAAVPGAHAFLHLFKQLMQEEIDPNILLAQINAASSLYCRTWLANQVLNYKGRHAARQKK